MDASHTNMEVGRSHQPSRPCLTILDLPDELLLDIFGLVEYLDPALPHHIAYTGTKDIKNARLVCRRFCAVSSQLLGRVVCIQFNEESLARLDEISRHPTIAKGVRTIRVVLHFYNRSFVDLDRFGSYHAKVLDYRLHDFADNQRSPALRVPEETASALIAEGRAVAAALRRLAPANPDAGHHSLGDQDHQRALLDEIHREYLTRLEKQESLLESAKFFRLLGAAIARMPAARKLEFKDRAFETIEKHQLLVPGRDVWGAVRRLTHQPINGREAKCDEDLELPNYQCVLRVIDAVRSAGASLNGIDIKLANSGYPGGLAPAPHLRQEFSSGMQQLKEFSLVYNDGRYVAHDADHLEAFLSACLDTPSLQKLSLDLGWRRPDSEKIDLGKVMGSRARPNLTNIFLSRVGIHLSDLELFLEGLPESLDVLIQEGTHLLSGTWQEALDAFRRKRGRVIRLGGRPWGAECDDMDGDDIVAMFYPTHSNWNRSAVDLYISNQFPRMLNPFQARKDGIGLAEVLGTLV